jgi:hypothetical protein
MEREELRQEQIDDTGARKLVSDQARRRAPRQGLRQQLRAAGVGRRGCAVLGVFGVAIVVLSLIFSVLTLERAAKRLLTPPTPTIVPTPDIARLGAASVVGAPSIDVALIRRVLLRYNSPAVDEAQTFYDLGVARGIDPAYCLAFFIVESAAGTQGVARTTYSVGNIRALSGQPSFEGYRRYDTWRDGIADWYRLIDELYIHELGLSTVDAIVPVYAPSADSNDPAAYILTVKRLVAGWRDY